MLRLFLDRGVSLLNGIAHFEISYAFLGASDPSIKIKRTQEETGEGCVKVNRSGKLSCI